MKRAFLIMMLVTLFISLSHSSTPTTHHDAHNEACLLPVNSGSCELALTRWFYEDQSQSCKAFTWTGCGGNRNNFPSRAQCQHICSVFGIDDNDYHDHPEFHHRSHHIHHRSLNSHHFNHYHYPLHHRNHHHRNHHHLNYLPYHHSFHHLRHRYPRNYDSVVEKQQVGGEQQQLATLLQPQLCYCLQHQQLLQLLLQQSKDQHGKWQQEQSQQQHQQQQLLLQKQQFKELQLLKEQQKIKEQMQHKFKSWQQSQQSKQHPQQSKQHPQQHLFPITHNHQNTLINNVATTRHHNTYDNRLNSKAEDKVVKKEMNENIMKGKNDKTHDYYDVNEDYSYNDYNNEHDYNYYDNNYKPNNYNNNSFKKQIFSSKKRNDLNTNDFNNNIYDNKLNSNNNKQHDWVGSGEDYEYNYKVENTNNNKIESSSTQHKNNSTNDNHNTNLKVENKTNKNNNNLNNNIENKAKNNTTTNNNNELTNNKVESQRLPNEHFFLQDNKSAIIMKIRKKICHQTPFHGPCDQGVQRWAFDRKKRSCLSFQYGGCMGNENNFRDKSACEKYCGSF